METKNDIQKEYSTCLENFAFAETMQKNLDQQETHLFISRLPDNKSRLWTAEGSEYQVNKIIASLMTLHRCADCAIRCRAKAKPHSLFARIHRWHMTWWPGWKIYQAELRARGARVMAGEKIFIQEKM